MPRKAIGAGASGAPRVYRNKPLVAHVADSYRRRAKSGGATQCNECGAVYLDGRWQWAPTVRAVHEQLCPACQRIRDDLPAGFISLHGPLAPDEEQQVRALAGRVEAAERKEHPLQRIMATELQAGGDVLITTTDTHLARRLGEAIHGAFHGRIDYHYGPDENLLRADWRR